MLKKFSVIRTEEKLSYKYCVKLNYYTTPIILNVNSSLLTFGKGKPYLALPKTNCELIKQDNNWLLKRASNRYTFAVFLYSGTYGKAEITEINPKPNSIFYYTTTDKPGENSLGAIFTVEVPIVSISFKRLGKELHPSLYSGTFQMKLNGETKCL